MSVINHPDIIILKWPAEFFFLLLLRFTKISQFFWNYTFIQNCKKGVKISNKYELLCLILNYNKLNLSLPTKNIMWGETIKLHEMMMNLFLVIHPGRFLMIVCDLTPKIFVFFHCAYILPLTHARWVKPGVLIWITPTFCFHHREKCAFLNADTKKQDCEISTFGSLTHRHLIHILVDWKPLEETPWKPAQTDGMWKEASFLLQTDRVEEQWERWRRPSSRCWSSYCPSAPTFTLTLSAPLRDDDDVMSPWPLPLSVPPLGTPTNQPECCPHNEPFNSSRHPNQAADLWPRHYQPKHCCSWHSCTV